MDSLTQTTHAEPEMSHKILVNSLESDVVKPLGNITKIFKPR